MGERWGGASRRGWHSRPGQGEGCGAEVRMLASRPVSLGELVGITALCLGPPPPALAVVYVCLGVAGPLGGQGAGGGSGAGCPLCLSSCPPPLGPSAACPTSQVMNLGVSVGRAHLEGGGFPAHLRPALLALPLAPLPEAPTVPWPGREDPGESGHTTPPEPWPPPLSHAWLCCMGSWSQQSLRPLLGNKGSPWPAVAQP